MLQFVCTIFQQFQSKIESLKNGTNYPDCSDCVDCSDCSNPIENNSKISVFRLPISYVEPDKLHPLSETVSLDLELSNSENENTIYEHLLLPKHDFAKRMIPEWNKQFTTDIDFLNDSQQIIKQMSKYKVPMSTNKYEVNCEKITNIWNDVKTDDDFLDKYRYMEWSMLKHLNESSSFLQCLSFINIISPLISLAIPIIFLFFPFIILKIQGIPITFSKYLEVLKDIAKHHFIGKTLLNMTTLSWDKVVYIMVTMGLYVLQIYQNIIACNRYYNNIQKINDSLIEIQKFSKYSVESMEHFLEISKSMSSYSSFNKDIELHYGRMRQLNADLCSIKPFTISLTKFNNIGYMLKCFYELHANKEYGESIQFSIGFEGYMNNLTGIHENMINGVVSAANLYSTNTNSNANSNDISNNNCEFKQQYYPPLMNESPVKNDCSFDKNIIISSPNKSGKTTILKTTTINIIFTQQFGYGFYESANLIPYTHIHSYLNIPDTSGRDSLFQAESRRCKEIISIIKDTSIGAGTGTEYNKSRHFCIFDELYSGTNPEEASKAGHAFLEYLSKFSNVNFILTTHYFSICKKFKKSDVIQNYKMIVNVLKDGSFEYTYKIKKGISKMKGGIRVLKDLDYPDEIIKSIENNV